MKVKNFSDAFPDVKIVEGIVFNDEKTNGLPLSEKQGVGSSILPLATN
jgi:hypothetical protein